LADVYETILDAWEFIIHTWYTCIADENENHVYRANRYDTIQYTKQVSNTDECEVLVLPVHSREMRHVLFLSTLVPRDRGNLLFCGTVEPWFNEPLFNEVLDIKNDILCPGQSYSKMYGIEPWYNEPRYNKFFDITNIIWKPRRKIYLDITNYNVNNWWKINAKHINSQQILVILMVKRQQPFSQRLIICHRHWHYSISTSINFCSIFFEIRKCWVVQHNNTKACFLVYKDNFLCNL